MLHSVGKTTRPRAAEETFPLAGRARRSAKIVWPASRRPTTDWHSPPRQRPGESGHRHDEFDFTRTDACGIVQMPVTGTERRTHTAEGVVADSSNELDVPEYSEANVKLLGRNLWYLVEAGRIESRPLVENSGLAEKKKDIAANATTKQGHHGSKDPYNGFSKWLRGCKGFRANINRWNWLDPSDYRALVECLVRTNPWAAPYVATDFEHLIRNPLFHAFASLMRVDRERIMRAARKLCGNEIEKPATFELYRPTLYTASLEKQEYYRAKVTITYDEKSHTILVHQRYVIPQLNRVATSDESKTRVEQRAHRQTEAEAATGGVADNGAASSSPVFYEFTGVLLPRAENLYVIVSVPDESQIPQTIFLNRFPEGRQRERLRPDLVNYMHGWVANIHEKSFYYTAPVAFRRVHESNWQPEFVDETAFLSDRMIGGHFALELSKRKDSKIYRQITEQL